MSSKKLRKYLAYYRKTLSDDPENIEARLRLAALFREMGRHRHAIEEYETAAKLLASDGLPLEAIAACKAILELDPSHRETQFFLARLYAQVPEATGDSVRVAQPVTPIDPRSGEGSRPRQRPENQSRAGSHPRIEPVTGPQSVVEPAITLDRPKEQASAPPRQEVTKRERPAVPQEEPQREEGTKLQGPMEQAELRSQSISAAEHPVRDDDRQTFDLDVFNIDSLGLDDESTGRWDSLDFLDDLDEPDTEELDLDDRNGSGANGTERMQREFRVSALPAIPLFSQLPRKVFVEFLDAMELERLPAGTEILRPGDPASCLYVIVHGEVRVEKELLDGRVVELAKMGEGQVFGEFRLLTGKGGRAGVIAETDVELLEVHDDVIYRVGRQYPELWEVLWKFYYDRMLNHAMATSRLFNTLSAEERDLVARHFTKREIAADEILFSRGQTVDALSLVVSGSVRVEVPDDDRIREIETLEAGAFVGVSPCAQELPATATIRARTDVVVFDMSGAIFRELLFGLPEVAEAVRGIIRQRRARTSGAADTSTVADWI